MPTFWSERDGDLKAGLVFRVGHADERLARRGITHLVEHLALYEVSRRPDHVNGMVDTTTTTFCTVGSDRDVVDFFAAVSRALRHLPTDRVELENRVLATEAQSTAGQDVGSVLAIWRYGAATYGLSGYEELGVGHHTAEELSRWAESRFTRGNAVLWLIGGPPPAGLRLDLPDGPRVEPPRPSSTVPRTPAYFTARVNGVAASSVVRRSTAAGAYAELLRHRLHERLRVAEGVSYSPVTSYERRDARTAQITAFVDGLAAVHGRLVTGFVETVDRLAEKPPAAREVAEVIELLSGAATREPGAATVAAAVDELFGTTPRTLADTLAGIEALTVTDLATAAAEARDAMLLMVPAGHRPPGKGYRPAPATSEATVDGQVFLSVESATPRDRRTIAPGNDSRSRLCVGSTGISLVTGPSYMTIRFDQCEAMLCWPDGARHLIGRDGLHVRVEPTMWRDGPRPAGPSRPRRATGSGPAPAPSAGRRDSAPRARRLPGPTPSPLQTHLTL